MCSKDLTELPELKELLNRLIVRFYGGTCRCDSNPGSGSTFTVSLPLKKGKLQ